MADRNLTDADISALAEALREKMVDQLYTDIGKGFVGWMWKILIGFGVALSVYGASRGIK